MTNLTTEQYRDVLKRTKNPIIKNVPSIQHLLRLAIDNYFRRFGVYPEIAGVGPGKIGFLGDQTEFSGGMAFPVATPMATIMVGRATGKKSYTVISSADVGKPHKITFSCSKKRPLKCAFPSWLDYVKGVMTNYPEEQIPGFDALIETSLPFGVGFGSSAALEVAVYTFLEVLIGKKAESDKTKAELCQKAEKEFPQKEVGLVERLTSVAAKDRHAILIDCKTYECEWVPFSNPDVCIMAIDSHFRDELDGTEYPERTKYINKAAEILGVESLRDCTEEDIEVLKEKVEEIKKEMEEARIEAEALAAEEAEIKEKEEQELRKLHPELFLKEEEVPQPGEDGVVTEEGEDDVWGAEKLDVVIKRATFFITEMKRIRDGIEAWGAGDVEKFGNILVESHNSLKDDFELHCPYLDFLVEASLEIQGVFGSRATGMGLGYGGGVVTLLNKQKMMLYANQLTQKFYEEEEKNRILFQEEWQKQHDEKMREKEERRRKRKEGYDPTRSGSMLIAKVKDLEHRRRSSDKKKHRKHKPKEEKRPSIISIERTSKTWGRHDHDRAKEERLKRGEDGRKRSSEEEGEVSPEASEESLPPEYPGKPAPTFYVITPFPGARMMFVTKPDYLRSLFSSPVPHPKALMRTATEQFESVYGRKAEIAGLAPASVGLFGEFMEFHSGHSLQIALPMMTAVVGSKNDSVYFSFKTTAPEIDDVPQSRFPVPCVRPLEKQETRWVNYTNGVVTNFRGHVPGFDALIVTSIPLGVGVNSCSALQASIYTFLEGLTKQPTEDIFEKADRCQRSEFEFMPQEEGLYAMQECSLLKYFPTLLSKEGNILFIDSKKQKTGHFFIDDPAFVFLIATVKEITTDLTLSDFIKKTRLCKEAAEILGKDSLCDAEEKHIRCLIKRDATEEMIKVARYIISEHERTIEAVKAIKNNDYPRLGLLMTQSHKSLREHYEVSNPEVEDLIELALQVNGVLGAKILGKGLNGSIIILVRITCADQCIRHMRRKYPNKEDKPVFYVTKPTSGAFGLDIPEMEYIP